MENELTILVGIPGSGKTTWANQMIQQYAGVVKVSRDDVRMMLRSHPYPGTEYEPLVSSIVDLSITSALKKGWDVILDNTHCTAATLRETIDKFGKEYKVRIQIIGSDLTLDEIKLRNAKRQSPVADDILDRMYSGWKYIVANKAIFDQQITTLAEGRPVIVPFNQDKGLPPCIIVDIDGTVAERNNRGPFEFDKVLTDTPVEEVIHVVHSLNSNNHIVFMSGRDESCRADTEEWIRRHIFISGDIELYMRGAGDMRKDSIVKKELFMKHIAPKYYTVACLDDRKQVVDMWREELGLKCLQVAEGNF